MLPSTPALAAFATAATLLAVTPGPGVVYIVTRTLAQGRAAGLASVAGVALGNLANAIAASLGLAALMAASATAFTLVKLAGAAFLVWLAVQALRAPAPAADGTALPPAAPPARIARDGFLVALLNPKTTLFFAAFLSPFIDPAGPAALQAVLLSALFVAIAAASDSAYVLLARAAVPLLRGGAHRRAGRWAAAAVYLALGVYAALASGRPQRGG